MFDEAEESVRGSTKVCVVSGWTDLLHNDEDPVVQSKSENCLRAMEISLVLTGSACLRRQFPSLEQCSDGFQQS